jgi:hypothetical protein
MKHFDPRTSPRDAGLAEFTAANDPQGSAASVGPARAARGTSPGGWDPVEIWRTRVRDARRDAPSPSRA